jgi:hypothetical protein
VEAEEKGTQEVEEFHFVFEGRGIGPHLEAIEEDLGSEVNHNRCSEIADIEKNILLVFTAPQRKRTVCDAVKPNGYFVFET